MPRKKGARVAKAAGRRRFFVKLDALGISLRKMLAAPVTSVMTFLVIGITMALPASLYVLLENSQTLSGVWENSAQVSVFLKTNVSAEAAVQLADKLRLEPAIAETHYISPQEGLSEFQKYSGLSGVQEQLGENPIPGVLTLQLALENSDAMSLGGLVQRLKQLPSVASVQMDLIWVKRLFAALQFLKHLVWGLSGLLGGAVVLMMMHTIGLLVQQSQRDIEVFKLLGATQRFIARPFVYAGAFYGTVGSVVMLFFVKFFLIYIGHSLSHLLALYDSHFALTGFSLKASAALLATGGVLGVLAAKLAVSQQLKTLKASA